MKKTTIRNCLKFPNCIIEDVQLTYSAKAVAVTLYAHRNMFNYCRLGLMKLARYSGCSIATVRKALVQLAERGYITTYRNYAWCTKRSRLIFRKDAIICNISTHADFTFIPRKVLHLHLRKSSFATYLYICRAAGNKGRAFPSLRQISETLVMGTATVCRALQELSDALLIHREHCVKQNGSHACNSYFMLRRAECAVSEASQGEVRPSAPTALVKPVRVVRLVLSTVRQQRNTCAYQLSFSGFSIPIDETNCNPIPP